jgi:hypothetical protein
VEGRGARSAASLVLRSRVTDLASLSTALGDRAALGAQDPSCRLWIRRASTARSISGVAVPAVRCDACGRPVPAADTVVAPGPGLEPPADDDSWVTTALTTPHRLLEPLRAADAPAVL